MKKLISVVVFCIAFGMSIARADGPENTIPPTPITPVLSGWVYGPYTTCSPQTPDCNVYVPADGLNFRQSPDGLPILALTNGVPLHGVGSNGDWDYVQVACPLWPTGLVSWDGIPVFTCAN